MKFVCLSTQFKLTFRFVSKMIYYGSPMKSMMRATSRGVKNFARLL